MSHPDLHLDLHLDLDLDYTLQGPLLLSADFSCTIHHFFQGMSVSGLWLRVDLPWIFFPVLSRKVSFIFSCVSGYNLDYSSLL